MAISEFSKKYHEKMFPGISSEFLKTDPEFIERFDNFAFDEVINQKGNLSGCCISGNRKSFPNA